MSTGNYALLVIATLFIISVGFASARGDTVATGGHRDAIAPAKPCDAGKIEEILAPANESARSVAIDCSAKLPAGSTITKQVMFSGAAASNLTLDCSGGTIGSSDPAQNPSPLVRISSQRDAVGNWQRPEGVTIQSCVVKGCVSIYGLATSPGAKGGAELIAASHTPRFTAFVRTSSPRNIVFDHVTIEGNGKHTPIYLGVGVTHFTLKNSVVGGETLSPAIYFEAETGHNTIANSLILTSPAKNREQLAIDGSSGNTITNNTFRNFAKGAIFIYRNCGERGMVRHTTPQRNVIENNVFDATETNVERTVVFVSSRGDDYIQKHQDVCNADAGYPFGSSADDHSFATNNIVRNNVFINIDHEKAIRVGEQPNFVSGNTEK